MLACSLYHFLQLLWAPASLMGVQVAQIAVLMLHEQVGITRSAPHYGKEVLQSHDLDDSIKILLLSLVQSDARHDQNYNIFLFCGDLIEEDRVIVADCHAIGKVEVLQYLLQDESCLAGVVPFEGLFVRIEFLRNTSKCLEGEWHIAVVPEESSNVVELGSFSLEEEVGGCHLRHSEHAPPA